MRCQHAGNLGLFLRRQFAGVAALAACIDPSIDECSTERLGLLFGFWPDIVAFNDGTQTMRGGNGFQSRRPAP